jgi:hypothetical protein
MVEAAGVEPECKNSSPAKKFYKIKILQHNIPTFYLIPVH